METGGRQLLTKDSPNAFSADSCPAFSPDGRQIAFRRNIGAGKWAVMLVSPLGGPERILTGVTHMLEVEEYLFGPFLSWSPDGRALAVVEQKDPDTGPNLVLYMMETGGKYPLTKTLAIVYRKDSLSQAAKYFIEFIRSTQGLKILRENDYVLLER